MFNSHYSSRKQTVHVPLRLHRLAPVKTFAVKPETMTAEIPDEIIVARRSRLAVRRAPPLRADAFGALRAGDVISHAAPAKSPRRPVRHECGAFRRFGLRQQQERARSILGQRRPNGF